VILIIDILQKALMIAAFVTVMMLLVEYVNVQTQGVLLNALAGSRISQYVLAALLGAVPGCLGAFVVVALYAHRRVTLGALVTAMIATSGDEAFVMLALFPATMLCLTAGLMAVGIITGYVTDRCLPTLKVSVSEDCHFLDTHDKDDCRSFTRGSLLAAWRSPSPQRLVLVLGLAGLVVALTAGVIGPPEWGWERMTFLVLMAAGVVISATVPEHFLRQHLWHHVVIRHVPRVGAWTVAALAAITALTHVFNLEMIISSNPWALLAGAAIVGLLPESGPHLIFVTMYAEGLSPLSVLVVSAIVQDGHGMLPLLSASKRAFVIVKLINVVAGVLVGAIMMLMGG
jgi:hypothetical protein